MIFINHIDDFLQFHGNIYSFLKVFYNIFNLDSALYVIDINIAC